MREAEKVLAKSKKVNNEMQKLTAALSRSGGKLWGGPPHPVGSCGAAASGGDVGLVAGPGPGAWSFETRPPVYKLPKPAEGMMEHEMKWELEEVIFVKFLKENPDFFKDELAPDSDGSGDDQEFQQDVANDTSMLWRSKALAMQKDLVNLFNQTYEDDDEDGEEETTNKKNGD